MDILNFEKPIAELETKIEELRTFGSEKNVDLAWGNLSREKKFKQMKNDNYGKLTVWQRVQIARHPSRPYTLDYISMMTTDFMELHGDRLFADDAALIAGFAKIHGRKVIVMGHQKGRDTKENIMRNFGCAHPEGYRKALRVLQLAEKFRIPVLVFIDTPGAYPGLGAEERGQAQAIATNLRDMAGIKTPIIATVIGEGGSGGALGIGVADRVYMLQNSYYSVISPEGCASILWRNSIKAPDAANALKLTAENLLEFGIIDGIVPEPVGGAHRDPEAVIKELRKVLLRELDVLSALSGEQIVEQRYQKFRKMGDFEERAAHLEV